MSVRERQNDERSLDKLVAQRLLYRRVKRVENWRLVSMLAVAGLLLWGLAQQGAVSQAATVVVVLLWFVDQSVLVRCASGMKEEAAAIQEDFDCWVLDLPWSEHHGVERPTQHRVKELARQGSNSGVDSQQLRDWYRGDIPVAPLAAQLHCQRINCRWDGRLRREWLCFVVALVSVLVGAALAIAALAGVLLLEVVLAFAAGLRLAAWLSMEQHAQSAARQRMERLHGYLSRVGSLGGQATLCDVRLVQAAIFAHRRACPTVPDWFYGLRRKAHEEVVSG